jgi:hypothetical protein
MLNWRKQIGGMQSLERLRALRRRPRYPSELIPRLIRSHFRFFGLAWCKTGMPEIWGQDRISAS